MTIAICQRMNGDRALLTISDENVIYMEVYDTVFEAADWCKENGVEIVFK